MHNYCSNHISIEGPVGAITNIHFIIEQNGGNPMALRPHPEGDCSNEWAISNWGVKWPMDVNYLELNEINDELYISIQGYTAWSPPIELLRFISERFTDVVCHITFYEEGMDFVGAATCISGQVFYSESSISDYLPENFDWNSDGYQDVINDTIDFLMQHHENVVSDQLTVKGTI